MRKPAGTGPAFDKPNPIGAGLRRISRELHRLKRQLKTPALVARPKRIGIPRGFYFYEYPKLFETFFAGLAIEPVVSGRTTRKTIECASRVSEAEHCLPNKLFDAHVTELVEKVDMVFVPRVLSMIPGHNECPKLGALPDAIRADISRSKPVLTVDIDEEVQPLRQTLLHLGRVLGCDRALVARAADEALAKMQAARAHRARKRRGGDLQMLVIGHPYTLHDQFVADPVVRKLEAMDVGVELLADQGEPVPADFVLWGAANRTLQRLRSLTRESCAAVVHLSCFNCGCDAMMTNFYREVLKGKNIPYLLLVIDEHSATAGVDTRLEAFVDSLGWQA